MCGVLTNLFEGGLAYTRIIKAWKNDVGDNGCVALGKLLLLQGSSRGTHMRELHLSHNNISAAGALALLAACKQVYPIKDCSTGAKQPLWLRLHCNVIDSAMFATRAGRLFCECLSSNSCNPRTCRQNPVPPFHLPFFHDQRHRDVGGGGAWGRGGGLVRDSAPQRAPIFSLQDFLPLAPAPPSARQHVSHSRICNVTH